MRVLMVALVLSGCATAAPEVGPPPVCGDPAVLREVRDALRARGEVLALDVPPVGEVSAGPPVAAGSPQGAATGSPPLAYCAARGHTVGYDTNRYGSSAVHEPFIVRYTIELRRNGMFVAVQ